MQYVQGRVTYGESSVFFESEYKYGDAGYNIRGMEYSLGFEISSPILQAGIEWVQLCLSWYDEDTSEDPKICMCAFMTSLREDMKASGKRKKGDKERIRNILQKKGEGWREGFFDEKDIKSLNKFFLFVDNVSSVEIKLWRRDLMLKTDPVHMDKLELCFAFMCQIFQKLCHKYDIECSHKS
uniref:Uncharacterized protein n=1 Tax=Pithovirus LCPAC304 TaxID=2506594 RepID=A0A481Z8G4_9VIRU|nr:MAG: hypothetical protein LCPAC304_04140 [Pithovirus LCPAC304]